MARGADTGARAVRRGDEATLLRATGVALGREAVKVGGGAVKAGGGAVKAGGGAVKAGGGAAGATKTLVEDAASAAACSCAKAM